MKAQPLIAVRDVKASARWYQELLDCASHGDGHYARLIYDGELILQLHRWGDYDHPNVGDIDAAPHGYGVLLWFETGHFDAAVDRAKSLAAAGQGKVVSDRHYNASANHLECWIHDPDDYVIVIASVYGVMQ